MGWQRKTGSAVLAAVLIGTMVLAGCKKEEKAEPAPADMERTASAAAETAAAPAEEAISAAAEMAAAETEKTVLLDTDIVQLTLEGVRPFSAGQDDGTTKTAAPEVEISFAVTNKGEDEIVLDLRDLKAGGKDVQRILLEGDIAAPGETMTFRYGILPKEAEGSSGSLTWEMVSEQGLTGTVRVMNIEGELAKAEFSTVK